MTPTTIFIFIIEKIVLGYNWDNEKVCIYTHTPSSLLHFLKDKWKNWTYIYSYRVCYTFILIFEFTFIYLLYMLFICMESWGQFWKREKNQPKRVKIVSFGSFRLSFSPSKIALNFQSNIKTKCNIYIRFFLNHLKKIMDESEFKF